MHTIRICRSAGQHVILLQHIHSIPRLIVSGGGEGRGASSARDMHLFAGRSGTDR